MSGSQQVLTRMAALVTVGDVSGEILTRFDAESRVYFKEMKSHGTRVVTPTDLQFVSGEDTRATTRFVIVDAVGETFGKLGGGHQSSLTVNQLQSLLCAA